MSWKMLLPVAVALGLLAAESVSDLLQKGIYTQETMGDLDAAIQIYRQIVGKAQSSRPQVAQAQFRLAACLLKKGATTEASELLEKLVRDYPEGKDLVAQARALLGSNLRLLAEPWTDGEVLQITVKLPAGLELGVFYSTAEATEAGGKQAWRFGTRRYIPGMDSVSWAIVDRETFRPISSYFRHPALAEVTAEYDGDRVRMHSPGKEERTDALASGAFDNEQGMHLFRRLPLAAGYKAKLPFFASFSVGNLGTTGSVTGKETIQTSAGKFECFKLEIEPIKQSFWVSADANRYPVKFDVTGAIGELTAIERLSNAPREYRSDELHVSLTTPPRWLFWHQKVVQGNNQQIVHLIDPEAAALTMFVTNLGEAAQDFGPEELKAWADKKMIERPKTLKDWKVRPESSRTPTVAGRPAISLIADYSDGDKAMVEHVTWIGGKGKATAVTSRMEAKNLAGFQPKLDSILQSLQVW